MKLLVNFVARGSHELPSWVQPAEYESAQHVLLPSLGDTYIFSPDLVCRVVDRRFSNSPSFTAVTLVVEPLEPAPEITQTRTAQGWLTQSDPSIHGGRSVLDLAAPRQ